MFTLRDYQQDLISKTFTAWSSGKRRLLLQLSTGGGKTIIFAAIASEFTSREKGVLVVAHREELILQAAEKLAAATLVQPGIITRRLQAYRFFDSGGQYSNLSAS